MKCTSRSFKEIWVDLKGHGNLTSIKGIKRKFSFAFIAVMDMRIRGDWAKKNAEAKFWGFFLGNTGKSSDISGAAQQTHSPMTTCNRAMRVRSVQHVELRLRPD